MQTKIDAINACLRGIGASPVSSLDDGNLDASIAGQVVDAVTADIQSKAWWFNREPNWKLSCDALGYIEIPNTVTDIVATDRSDAGEITIRGNKLYDVTNHTYDFRERLKGNSSLSCTFTVTLSFEDLPPVAKKAVTYIARRLFAQDMEVDVNRWKFQSTDEKVAMVALERQDAKQRGRSYGNNAAVALLKSRAGGYNSGSLSVGYRGSRGERS